MCASPLLMELNLMVASYDPSTPLAPCDFFLVHRRCYLAPLDECRPGGYLFRRKPIVALDARDRFCGISPNTAAFKIA